MSTKERQLAEHLQSLVEAMYSAGIVHHSRGLGKIHLTRTVEDARDYLKEQDLWVTKSR